MCAVLAATAVGGGQLVAPGLSAVLRCGVVGNSIRCMVLCGKLIGPLGVETQGFCVVR